MNDPNESKLYNVNPFVDNLFQVCLILCHLGKHQTDNRIGGDISVDIGELLFF